MELDQEQEPWSLNSIDRAHRVAQVATVVRLAQGCRTSSVKRKRLSNTGALKGWSARGYEARKVQTGTGQKSNRDWSKASKIRASVVKYKI